MSLSVIILAGGTGSRMESKTPKVLHHLAGKPLLEHVVDTVKSLNVVNEVFIVYGYMGAMVRTTLDHRSVTWVEQKERLGTGHAVMQVLPHLDAEHKVLILYGDVPLITAETLEHFVEATGDNQLGLLTAIVQDPKGLGRIVRDEYRQVIGIVEDKDASELERQIREINTGIYCVPAKLLKSWLPRIKNTNAQGEYYLTDIVKFARQEHVAINVSEPRTVQEIYGANNRVELAKLERIYQRRAAEKLMLNGASMADPDRVDIRGSLVTGQDCYIDVGVIFEGEVQVGDDCTIGPNCVIKDAKLGDRVHIKANSVVEDAIIDSDAQIGPFSRIRPGTHIQAGAQVGNFVELKKTHLGRGSKVNHLSYVGDAEVGDEVNVGAGVITCNYDGANKHQTRIGDRAFIGSDVQLVAPIEVGADATIGAGSTITRDVPPSMLTLSRAKQQTIEGWKRPKKASIAEEG